MNRPLALSALTLLALSSSLESSARAQTADRKNDRAEARAQADTSDSSRSTDSSKSSHTRRVVVVNGETVVDEETVDGKAVRSRKGARRATPRPAPVPDVEQLLRDLEKDMPAAARDALRRAAKNGGTSGSSSYSRRVVVKNGETIVDEEIVDGKPSRGARRPTPRGAVDLDEIMRELQRDLPPDAREMLKRAQRDGTSSKSSASRRVTARDGKTVIDEESSNGKPVRGKGGVDRRPEATPRRATPSKATDADTPLRPVRFRDRVAPDRRKTDAGGAKPLRRVFPRDRGDR